MRKLRYIDVTDAQRLVDEAASRGYEVDMGSIITVWRKASADSGVDWLPVTDPSSDFWTAYAYLSEVYD